MERETLAVDVCNAAAIPGNAGKYMSMANGLMVESAPRMRIIKTRFWLGWDIVFGRLRSDENRNGEAGRLDSRHQTESKNARPPGRPGDTTGFDAFNIHPISIPNPPGQDSIEGVSFIGDAPPITASWFKIMPRPRSEVAFAG